MMNYKETADFESNQLSELCGLAEKNSYIDPQLFSKYEVKRGLRDISGRGVLAQCRQAELTKKGNLKGEMLCPQSAVLNEFDFRIRCYKPYRLKPIANHWERLFRPTYLFYL